MHFLITAGGTREYIDPVRFISNASTGKMGYALAAAAAKAGHHVMLISAPTSLRTPKGVTLLNVETSAQMFAAVKRNFRRCDCLIMAAAVSDYRPINTHKTKMKRTTKNVTIKLKPTPDILRWAGTRKKKNQIVVGFALEDRNLRKNAEKKLRDKKLDMIVANTPAAVGADESQIQIKMPASDWLRWTTAGKTVTARRLIKLLEKPCKRR